MSKKGQKNRRFTPEEDARLVALRLEHWGDRRGPLAQQPGGLGAIAKKLGRPRSSVQVRLRMLAEREEAGDP